MSPAARAVLVSCIVLAACAALPSQAVPAPADVIGFAPGTDGRLADYDGISAWFQALAAASDRVQLVTAGLTTEGRPMLLAIISSAANIGRLEQIREANLALTDPRRTDPGRATEIIGSNPAIVLINESIHSSEVGPAQAGMVTAHHLATTTDPEWLRILDDVVVLMLPCHNPDGYEKVVSWWRETAEDPSTRGAPMPWLYHRYAGHDNNRDWFLFNLAESRVTVEAVHMRWRPQIVVDQHQMGSRGPRLFVPPFIEPYEPNVHPLLKERLENLGTHLVWSLAEQGMPGVAKRQIFDAWSPSRAFQHYHGGVRLLTEAASAAGADPLPDVEVGGAARVKGPDNPAPWAGGRWALSDIVRYSTGAALEAVRHASRERPRWLESFWRVHVDFVAGREGPAAFVIPADEPRRSALAKLRDVFRLGGVEVLAATAPFEAAGRTWPAGSLVIPNGQPCFGFARALLETTPYPLVLPAGGGPPRRPYDATCHALPLLMDVAVTALPRGTDLPPGLLPADEIRAPAPPAASAWLLDPRDAGQVAAAIRALHRGLAVERVDSAAAGLPAGSLIVRGELDELPEGTRPAPAPPDLTGAALRAPRIGLYASWTASMDEGWTRWLLDHLAIPYRRLHDAEIQAGALGRNYDVIVVPDMSARDALQGPRDARMPPAYRGGLGEAGADALRQFVREGGTLVALNRATDLAQELFALPLEAIPGRRDRSFYVPGTALRAEVAPDAAIGRGLGPSLPVFFWNSRGWKADASAEAAGISFPLRYATADLVAGGFAEGAAMLAGAGALAIAPVGAGRAILFGFPPQFRAWTWGTIPLFLDALLAPTPHPAEGE